MVQHIASETDGGALENSMSLGCQYMGWNIQVFWFLKLFISDLLTYQLDGARCMSGIFGVISISPSLLSVLRVEQRVCHVCIQNKMNVSTISCENKAYKGRSPSDAST